MHLHMDKQGIITNCLVISHLEWNLVGGIVLVFVPRRCHRLRRLVALQA